jgi:hypothetical protein
LNWLSEAEEAVVMLNLPDWLLDPLGSGVTPQQAHSAAMLRAHKLIQSQHLGVCQSSSSGTGCVILNNDAGGGIQSNFEGVDLNGIYHVRMSFYYRPIFPLMGRVGLTVTATSGVRAI